MILMYYPKSPTKTEKNVNKFLLGCLLIISTNCVLADGHSPDEQEVLTRLTTYFQARNASDWKTVVAHESKKGTYGTNSDGSFHKPLVFQTVEDWATSGQGGSLSIRYPEAVQLSDGVVYVRCYYEGMTEVNGKSKPYRTRVTMNWVREDGTWVVKSQHYSSASFGGVHVSQSADFED